MVENIKKNLFWQNNSSGFLFLEIIVAIALISIAFITLLGVGFLVLRISNSIQTEAQADFLAKEEFEAVRNFRDGTTWATNGLGSASTGNGNPYHLANNSGVWVLAPGAETKGIFTRQVIFDKVSRSPSTFYIEDTYNPSNNNDDTRKVTIKISWQDRYLQYVSYITNWKK